MRVDKPQIENQFRKPPPRALDPRRSDFFPRFSSIHITFPKFC